MTPVEGVDPSLAVPSSAMMRSRAEPFAESKEVDASRVKVSEVFRRSDCAAASRMDRMGPPTLRFLMGNFAKKAAIIDPRIWLYERGVGLVAIVGVPAT
jgi:hypothetical protein